MNESIEEKRKPTILRFRISTRLNYLLFPIDGQELIEAVAKIGYKVPPLPAPLDIHATVGFTGSFAQNGEVVLDGSADRSILGVTAKSYDQAIKAFDELSSLILKVLKVNLEKGSRFYEIQADLKFDSTGNPLESISSTFKRNQFMSNVAKILKQDISMFTLRFVTEGKVPNQEEWLDITIEPSIIMPNQRYNISVVFRSKDKSTVEKFGESLESNILSIIKTIEKS